MHNDLILAAARRLVRELQEECDLEDLPDVVGDGVPIGVHAEFDEDEELVNLDAVLGNSDGYTWSGLGFTADELLAMPESEALKVVADVVALLVDADLDATLAERSLADEASA